MKAVVRRKLKYTTSVRVFVIRIKGINMRNVEIVAKYRYLRTIITNQNYFYDEFRIMLQF